MSRCPEQELSTLCFLTQTKLKNMYEKYTRCSDSHTSFFFARILHFIATEINACEQLGLTWFSIENLYMQKWRFSRQDFACRCIVSSKLATVPFGNEFDKYLLVIIYEKMWFTYMWLTYYYYYIHMWFNVKSSGLLTNTRVSHTSHGKKSKWPPMEVVLTFMLLTKLNKLKFAILIYFATMFKAIIFLSFIFLFPRAKRKKKEKVVFYLKQHIYYGILITRRFRSTSMERTRFEIQAFKVCKFCLLLYYAPAAKW